MRSPKGLWGARWTENLWLGKMTRNVPLTISRGYLSIPFNYKSTVRFQKIPSFGKKKQKKKSKQTNVKANE